MNILFIILGFVCLLIAVGVYEFNQTRRADWIMNLVGIIGVLALFAAPTLLAIGLVKSF